VSRLKPVTSEDLDRLHGSTVVEVIKLPPHSVECEQSVLGALLLENAAWDQVADLVTEADFYRADHRLLWRTISRLISESKPADVITVAESLEGTRELDSVGGMSYIAALADNTPTSANIRHYATIVRDRAVLRRLAATCSEIQDKVYTPNGMETAQILDQAQEKILALGESAGARSGGFVELPPLLISVVETIDMLYNRDSPNDCIGVPSGFTDLDARTSGFGPGDLVILAARPSMGKTAMALNIAAHVGVNCKLPVGVFSMEMPKEALMLRLLCSTGSLNYHKVRKGLLHDEDWQRLTNSVGLLNDAPIQIDETGAITPAELTARARRLHRQYGKLGLLVVDYLQLMGVGGLGDTRAGEIGVATRALKKLAKELNCPVLALSQVNRGVESRPNKRPNMSDLRESGDIEQDADVIIFLYRDEVYNEDSKQKGVAEAVIAKQRNGPIGTVRLTWQGEYMRFANYFDAERM
jgi:replicative DNA helicase